MTEFVITGELKSNDKRDLLGVEDKNEWNVPVETEGVRLLPWRVDDAGLVEGIRNSLVSWRRPQIDAVPRARHHHRWRVDRAWHV